LHIGARRLRDAFPGQLARREAREILARCRRVFNLRYRRRWLALCWLRAGTVWAVDHSDAPAPIDGVYKKLLLVRDLASGFQLLALPVRTGDAAPVIAALAGLFANHGPPLVLKSDLGGAFTADDFAALLRRWGVLQLLSPPATPRYNGACEAGIGWIKRLVEERAARRGEPRRWTRDDVEAARREANETRRDRNRTTAEERWLAREPIDPYLRVLLAARVNELDPVVRSAWKLPDDVERTETLERSVRREALTRAMREQHLFEYRRGRLTPRIRE
jgi:hypothetical protein